MRLQKDAFPFIEDRYFLPVAWYDPLESSNSNVCFYNTENPSTFRKRIVKTGIVDNEKNSKYYWADIDRIRIPMGLLTGAIFSRYLDGGKAEGYDY
jgi:hypothetical protein